MGIIIDKYGVVIDSMGIAFKKIYNYNKGMQQPLRLSLTVYYLQRLTPSHAGASLLTERAYFLSFSTMIK